MLLTVDWDAFSGTRALVFDAPIWGTPDREHDRLEAWRACARKRGGGRWDGTGENNDDWDVLAQDFPLYSGWEALQRYAGVPTWTALSHADAWAWLDLFPVQDVLNIDSHHDLGNLRGDPARVRPGNWAGLALQAGKIRQYTCQYPAWHVALPVAEGFDLERTRAELRSLLPLELLERVTLSRPLNGMAQWPSVQEVTALLLVQSPAWTNPAHDHELAVLSELLQAQTLTPVMKRSMRIV